MRKLNLEPIFDIAKPIVKGVAYGALLSLLSKSFKLDVKVGEIESAGYGDAVSAIMNSDMLGSYKSEAVAMLEKCASSEYYKAVISIVENDDMLSSYKVKTIKSLSE
jgi:hypothetical protein